MNSQNSLAKILWIGFLLVFGFKVMPGQARATNVRELHPNQTIEIDRVTDPASDYYSFNMEKGEYLQITVNQKGVDISLFLLDPKGDKVAQMDSPNGDQGPEILLFVANSTGTFTLEAAKSSEGIGKGGYSIQMSTVRTATREDEERARATQEQALRIAEISKLQEEVSTLREQLKLSNSPETFKKVLEKALKALEISKNIEQKEFEPFWSFVVANIYDDNDDPQNAMIFYDKTITAINLIKEKSPDLLRGKILSFKNMGRIAYRKDIYDRALGFFEKALILYREDENDKEKGTILRYMAECYRDLNQPRLSEEFYLKAIGVFEKIEQPLEKGIVVSKLALLYESIENKATDALRCFNEAEKLLEPSPPKSDYYDRRIFNLSSLSNLHRKLKDYAAEAEIEDKIKKLIENINDKDILVLSYISWAGELTPDQPEKAVEIYTKILDLTKTYTGRADVLVRSTALRKMAIVLFRLKRKNESRKALREAFDLVKDLGDKAYLVSFREELGDLFFYQEEYGEAADYYEAALSDLFSKENSSKRMDYEIHASLLSKLGKSQIESGRTVQGLQNFRIALWLRCVFSQKDELANTIDLLTDSLIKLKKNKLAIFFGKQAVNIRQEFRQSIKQLPIEAQRSFLKGNRESYEKLVAMLIQEKRLFEALEIINIYQNQESFDFSANDSSLKSPTWTERERTALTSYEAEKVKNQIFSETLKKFMPIIGGRKLTEAENKEFQETREPFVKSGHEFEEMLKKIEENFEQPANEKDKLKKISEVEEMQRTLCDLSRPAANKTNNPLPVGTDASKTSDLPCEAQKNAKYDTLALYTFISNDKFYVLLVSPTDVKPFEVQIKASTLNNKILQYHELLKKPYLKTALLGKELYDVILGPVEDELKALGVKTIMWSLDGNLRYIPIAALWDGKNYLVERYQNVVFTRANRARLTQSVSPKWTGYGFSTSKMHSVKYIDGIIDFPPLIFSAEEMQIFRTDTYPGGIIDGNVFSDAEFSQDRFVEILKHPRPLVHISSHFLFRPGDAVNSFLLMGDGKPMSLYEMQNYKNLFQGVELLTLSACDTAAQYTDANGREIDGFAELAQRLGANSVMASLWPVFQSKTVMLMKEFYKNREIEKMTKAEALQKAQTDILHGRVSDLATKLNADTLKGKKQNDEVEIDLKYIADYKDEQLVHPYYWAPFVLYGNWK